MARINIEDRWWKDNHRGKALIKKFNHNENLVIGMMVQIWKASQLQWIRGNGGLLIPGKDFIKYYEGAQEILNEGLARLYKVKELELPPESFPLSQLINYELDSLSYNANASEKDLSSVLERYVYVCGSLSCHTWLISYRTQQSQAGRISARRPRDSRGRLLSSAPTHVQRSPTPFQRTSNDAGDIVGPTDHPTTIQRRWDDHLESNGPSNDHPTTLVQRRSNAVPTDIQRDPTSLLSSLNSNYINTDMYDETNSVDTLVPSSEGTSVKKLEFNLEAIYEIYPKRGMNSNMRKKRGMDYLKKVIKTQDDYEKAMRAARVYRKNAEAEGKIGTEFVQLFSTFFNSKGDWIEMSQMPGVLTLKEKNEAYFKKWETDEKRPVKEIEQVEAEASNDPETIRQQIENSLREAKIKAFGDLTEYE